jgi:acyl-CoA synthetase (NDP forming)
MNVLNKEERFTVEPDNGGKRQEMREFFYPSSIVVFGVADKRANLAQNIIVNCRELGFRGDIYPVGKSPGVVYGKEIITDPESLPTGIDLAVILVPAGVVADTLEICGRKGIHHAIISTAGFREFDEVHNAAERDMLAVAKQYGIRFLGPNCIGVICTSSGLCTPFNPLEPRRFKKGPVSLIIQSGGVTTQCAYTFSDEHVGFSKIISAGNKLMIDEVDLLEYLLEDEETEQIHLYLESIEHGRGFLRLAKQSEKPIVILKSNVSQTAAEVAKSHTAALSNNDTVVDGALKQAGIIRAENIHDMTVCAKALQLPPLRGNRLAALSLSGGFSVIIGDACEKYGFTCPTLPRELLDKIESRRRAGVIRMSNPMDLGDVHDIEALIFTLQSCLALDYIDGLVMSLLYEPQMITLFGRGMGNPEQIASFFKYLCKESKKPVAVSVICERQYLEEFKESGIFPVFNDPIECIRGLRVLRDYWHGRNAKD